MMAIASGMVVNPATTVRATPAALAASLLRRLEINMPMPAPSAIRVPVQRISSGKVTFLSIIARSSVKVSIWRLDATTQHQDGDVITRHLLAALATIGEQSPEQSRKIVERLYQERAEQVCAVNLEIYPNEGQSTNVLVIELPNNPKLRRKLFLFEARVAASGSFQPVSDDGQHYRFLSKFKLPSYL